MNLTTDLLWNAYREGAFPMTDDDGVVRFYLPPVRAIFPSCNVRVSRSLGKVIRRGGFEVTFDRAFEDVIRGCFRPGDNWLSEEIVEVFMRAFDEGWAHSCEVWVDGLLVGGVYGLAIGGYFSAESMFYRVTDMSKVALVGLSLKLKELGFVALDAQILNPHTESLGCIEVSWDECIQIRVESMSLVTDWGVRQAASSSS